MTAPLLVQVADWSHGIRFDHLPRAHVQAVKRLVLDTIGCGLGAVGCKPFHAVRPLLPRASDKEAASVWGTVDRSDLSGAILANGVLVRYLDFMDVYWAREICHPSENIPVALACAEVAHASGQRLIEALVAAYELQVRLADAFSFESLSMHHVSAAGLVAPLVMARLWNLPPRETAHAMALGGFRHLTHAALVRGELSMAKALGYASAASECVLSTRLAAGGFTGPLALLEGLGIQGLRLDGGTDCVTRVSLKQFPVQYSLQAPVEAALQLRAEIGRAAAIRELKVEMHADACRRTADRAKFSPTSRETADHSLPCCIALALIDGRLDHDQFDDDRWRDADIRALMEKIRVEPSAELEERWPDGRPVRLTASLQSGATHSVLVPVPRGDRTRPMSQADVEAKFRRLAEPALGAARTAQVIQCIGQLDELADVSALHELLSRS